MNKRSTLADPLANMPEGKLNQCQRVAATRLKQIAIHRKKQTRGIRYLIQSLPIRLLAFAFTAQIDAPSLPNWPAHPIRGTAPYTPPRYFW